LQIHGEIGYKKEMHIVVGDVRVYRIYEGTDEIQKCRLANNLLNRYARASAWD